MCSLGFNKLARLGIPILLLQVWKLCCTKIEALSARTVEENGCVKLPSTVNLIITWVMDINVQILGAETDKCGQQAFSTARTLHWQLYRKPSICFIPSPKSPILMSPWASKKILLGVRSRWRIPCPWMCASPSTSCRNIRQISSLLKDPGKESNTSRKVLHNVTQGRQKMVY